ncbi:hypothetical protein DS740_11345 [Bacillus sp. DM2]|nr:hypothetical protein DS740_11345 [Bacillus sp. DM2]
MKEKSGHNWACHSDETVLCEGFAKYIKRNRPDLNINEGQLISYETWSHEGEAKAIQGANTKELRQAQEKIQRLTNENDRLRKAFHLFVNMKTVRTAPELVIQRYSRYAKELLEGKVLEEDAQ